MGHNSGHAHVELMLEEIPYLGPDGLPAFDPAHPKANASKRTTGLDPIGLTIHVSHAAN